MSLTYLQDAASTSDASTYTFSAQNLGSAASDRVIRVIGFARGTVGVSSVTVTVGGVTATVDRLLGYTGTGNAVFLAQAEVPTGTTGDVVVTWSASQLRTAVALFRQTGDALGVLDYQAVQGFGLTASLDVDTAPGGAVLGAAFYPSSAGTGSWTWTGLVEDDDAQFGAEAGAYSVAHLETTNADGLTVTATSSTDVPPAVLVVLSLAPEGYEPVPAWVGLPWREQVDDADFLALVESPVRVVGWRAVMIDPDGVEVVDLPLIGGSVDYDGEAAEQWACTVSVAGSEWVPREVTDPLDPRSGLRCRLYWRALASGEWGEAWISVPVGTYYLEDPRISDDGTGPVVTMTGRDPLAILRRGGYGSQTVAVGGATVPAALTTIIQALSLSTPVRIDSSSAVTLPAEYELGGRDPLDDLVDIASLAGLVVRTDREGAILISPEPSPWHVRADWQEGATCPVVDLSRDIGTSGMVNSVTVVSTSPEVDPPVAATVEDTDPASPTRVDGPWGRRGLTVRSDVVASVEAAQGMAASILDGRRRPTEAVQVTVPSRGDLGFRDLVHLRRDASGVGGLFRVAGWRLPIWAADEPPGTMTVRLMTRSIP